MAEELPPGFCPPGFHPGDGIHDDPNVNPSSLRFQVGNLVMFNSEEYNGWFEAEVVKVAQRLVVGGQAQTSIAYLVWPMRDDVDGTCWVMEDSDEFIKPRGEDRTPDPSKFKPLLVVPEDPMYHLYSDKKPKYDYLTDEGENMADVFERMKIVDAAKLNHDGSVDIKKGGRRMKTACIEIPQEPIHGVDSYVAMMFASNQLNMRKHYSERIEMNPIEVFKSIIPKEKSLAQLESNAKKSSKKMLQLADVLMTGINGWRRDPYRACNLYCAAAWGCSEGEEPERTGIPNGCPEAMIATAGVAMSHIKNTLGYQIDQNVPFREWLGASLNDDSTISVLNQMFWWTIQAMSVHGWVTPLTLMLANTIVEINFLNDPRLGGDVGDDIKRMCEKLLMAKEYREKEMVFQEMQEKGQFPRGDPPEKVIQQFEPKCLEIFADLPRVDDTIHIEFRQVPRHPFSMIAISFIPSKRKTIKVIRLPDSLQVAPFSLESFQYVWLRIAFDIHLGRLGTMDRVRPLKFTVPDTHGNRAFCSFLKNVLKEIDTKVECVSHDITVKTGRKTKSKLGDLASEVMTVFLGIPGYLYDADSSSDVVTRAQDNFVDRLILQQWEDSEDMHYRQAEQMKGRGNQFFQANQLQAAIRCYSIALGHMRRVVDHNQETYKLLGTLLSNRAACFLGVQDQHSREFRKVFARNAINDCSAALESTWAKSSLPRSIMEKLRFRRDKASALYDSLDVEFDSMADVLFPTQGNSAAVIASSTSDTETANIDSAAETENNTATDAVALTSTRNITLARDCPTEVNESNQQHHDFDALMEYGEVLFKNELAKNSREGCPICLRDFNGELLKTYAVVLPCGEHALCAACACCIKIEADKAKQRPQCPLCRHSFDPAFVEGLPAQIIEKDQEIAALTIQLPMSHNEKISITERLLWTHRFEVPAVLDAIECLLDGQANGCFFREVGDLTHKQKSEIYRKARAPVEQLEGKLKTLLQEQKSLFDNKSLEKISGELRKARTELAVAREKAREDIYSQMNSVGAMGAQEDNSGGKMKIDYHGLHINEMRLKFKEHIVPILPVVKKLMIITGRGAHSSGSQGKLKKALEKLIGQYESTMYWQKVDENPGAIYVVWRTKK